MSEDPLILVTASADGGFHREIVGALQGRFRFDAHWQVGYNEVTRLRTAALDQRYVVIIDFADPTRAMAIARAVDGRSEFAALAIGGGGTREDMLQLMQVGIRDVLSHDVPDDVRQATRRAVSKLISPEELRADVCSFVPAKPGSGATTLATYVMCAASRLTTEPTLLLDFDVRLGVTSFLLKAGGNHTIVDALRQAGHLDPDLWASLVSQCGKLHLVGSGPVSFFQPVPAGQFAQILDFAAKIYSYVGIDLPGTMEEHETETLLRSKRIFLVCTADIGALHLARRKSEWLAELGLADRVAVILNCVERRNALGVADIERIIKMPVRYLVPAASAEIARAAHNGVAIEGSSAVAKEIAKIASDIISVAPLVSKPNTVRRFVEYFSVSAARDARRL